MHHTPQTCRRIVEACVILHNFIRDRYPALHNQVMDREDDEHRWIDGEWRRGRNMTDLNRVVAPNLGTRKAKRQRLLLKHYVHSSVGSVPWQIDRVLHG